LEFDFREAFSRIGCSVVQETNKRLREIMESDPDMDASTKTNRIINEMINDNIRVTMGVLEEYHQALMKYLSEKKV
jgi:hypothetical protein